MAFLEGNREQIRLKHLAQANARLQQIKNAGPPRSFMGSVSMKNRCAHKSRIKDAQELVYLLDGKTDDVNDDVNNIYADKDAYGVRPPPLDPSAAQKLLNNATMFPPAPPEFQAALAAKRARWKAERDARAPRMEADMNAAMANAAAARDNDELSFHTPVGKAPSSDLELYTPQELPLQRYPINNGMQLPSDLQSRTHKQLQDDVILRKAHEFQRFKYQAPFNPGPVNSTDIADVEKRASPYYAQNRLLNQFDRPNPRPNYGNIPRPAMNTSELNDALQTPVSDEVSRLFRQLRRGGNTYKKHKKTKRRRPRRRGSRRR